MELKFYSSNCSTTNPDSSPELVAAAANALSAVYDKDTGVLQYAPTLEYYMNFIVYAILPNDEKSLVVQHVSFWPNGEVYSKQLTEEQRVSVTAFEVQIADNMGYWDYATASLEAVIIGTFVYPTDTISFDSLPVSMVGFSGMADGEGFSHVQILVAEIQEDGTVGGPGHVWMSPFYPKYVDYSATLENIINLCEGRELTGFNVAYYFVNEEDGEFKFVSGHVVGGVTTEPTFTVQHVEKPLISVEVDVDDKAYCLDPVILTVNRRKLPEIQFVRVEIGNYIADYEFQADRNILEIDVAEYLKTVYALVDVFQFQKLDIVMVIKFYNGNQEHMLTMSERVVCVYGKKPEPVAPDCLRVQWLDKFGTLHDMVFKVFDKVAEGSSAQKYVVNREEHEDKNGERSISLAYVGANALLRADLETIVFADHVRALFGNVWKRVKVGNTCKTGTGRVLKNFEITIKYAI